MPEQEPWPYVMLLTLMKGWMGKTKQESGLHNPNVCPILIYI